MINLNDQKKIKEYTRFRYLLKEIQLYTLILMELNILNKVIDKSVTHNISST